MKIQLAAKFQKKVMDGYPALVQTDGRTNGTDNYSPLTTKVGGLKIDLEYIKMILRAKNFHIFVGKLLCPNFASPPWFTLKTARGF